MSTPASRFSCVAVVAAVLGCTAEAQPTVSAPDAQFIDVTDGTNWAAYGRTYDESHYSPLDQINVANVNRLGLAWYVDLPTEIGTASAPLAVDGVVYASSGLSKLQAIDAVSGKVLWTYDPGVSEVAGPKMRLGWGIRGIAYWNAKIYAGTQDGRLIAVDAETGQPVWIAQTTTPGDGLVITGPPRVFKGKVIIGNAGADYSAVRGYVTTYDAETGQQLWRFYTVPGDPAKGFENDAMAIAARTWTGELWKQGGGGTVWNAITYDHELDRIYIGTGNGSPWNAKVRSPDGGDNLFLCSIVALDAGTGKYLWHYQVNPAESWDYNAAMDISLATLTVGGKRRRVLMHAPKNGFFYVIDRDTGKLVSAEPFATQTWAQRIDLATGRPVENPEARFPNGTTVIWPSGAVGAHSWQPMAFSPKTGFVYIPTTELPGQFDDRGIDHRNWKRRDDYFLDGSFNPVVFKSGPPPKDVSFGHLQAWDPVRQQRVWSVQLGAPLNGGVAATGGNLVFQGNMKGELVAYEAATGKELWKFNAQNGIAAQPIVYLAGGLQQVTVIAGVTGGAGLFPGLGGVPVWDYRKQKRRILTFALNAVGQLPESSDTAPAPRIPPSFQIDSALARQGEDVYSAKCRMCHGLSLAAAGAAPDLKTSPMISSPVAFAEVVRNGVLKSRGMPQFQLTDEQLTALRHYVAESAR